MSDEMDAFLKGKATSEPVSEAPEQDPQAPELEPQPPEPAPDSSEGDEQQAKAPEDAPRDGRTVPLSALEKVRQDYKDRAARAETRAEELAKQLEEFKKQLQQQPQPQYQPPAPVDPSQDPQGFVSRVQEVVLNERLNTSELLARQAHGAETVDAAIEEFKAAAKADPSLFPKLYASPHPYDWMLKQVDKLRVQREMGDDPKGYEAKLEAKIRERLEAEYAQQQPAAPRVSPAAGMAPSLANVRSAAPRSAPAFSGPPSLGDVLGR